MRKQTAALALGFASTALLALWGFWAEPAWLDSAFVAFRYARRVSENGTLLLIGQDTPVEAFVDPLWTMILSFLGVLGAHEMRLQPFLGSGLLGLLCGLCVHWAVLNFSRWESVLTTLAVFALPTVAVAAHSGSDHLFLAVLSVLAVFSVQSDRDQLRGSHWTIACLVLLSLAGLAPLLLALVLAALRWPHDQRPVKAVLCTVVALSLARWVLFGQLLPHGAWILLSQADSGAFFTALKLTPILPAAGIVGLGMMRRLESWRGPFVAAAGVWILWGALGGNGAENFGSILVPAIGFLAIGAGYLADRLPHRALGLVVVVSLGLVDMRQGLQVQNTQIRSRISELKRAQLMSRFLRWRFEGDLLVVVQTPGMIPYFLKRRTFDLAKRTHQQPTDQAYIQTLESEVIIPEGAIVAKKATRLAVKKSWDWKTLTSTHYQHAIMQSREWAFIEEKSIWFNVYFRKDLDKYPPKWEAIYEKRREKARREREKPTPGG